VTDVTRAGARGPTRDEAPLVPLKFAVPQPAVDLVARERLWERLDAGMAGPVTLVVAPAGFGKTMLLSSWVSSGRCPFPVGWLSLDPADNDPSRLWSHLLEALNRSGGVPDDSGLRALETSGEVDAGFLSVVLAELADLPGPVVLVLDDVHELTSPVALDTLAWLVRRQPSRLRLLAASRGTPSLPFHRLRLEGGLTEISVDDLVFSVAETRDLLEAAEIGLTDVATTALQQRTEGWAAALRLSALSLRVSKDPAALVASMAGSEREVAAYLMDEVLAGQSAPVREFLLRTSILDELTGSLVDAVTGGRNARRVLAELENRNVLITRVGAAPEWYRYHSLFATMLREQLAAESPDLVPELHRRASRWYAEHDDVPSAVGHAVEGDDLDAAGALVAEHTSALVAQGHAALLDRLISRLPPQRIADDPRMGLAAVAAAYSRDELDVADERLEQVDAHAPLPEALAQQREWLAALLAVAHARVHGDALTVEAASTALESCIDSTRGSVWRGLRLIALQNRAQAASWVWRYDDAIRALQEARALPRDDDYQLSQVEADLAFMLAQRGDLTKAAELAEHALRLADSHGWTRRSRAFGAQFALAVVHYERNDLETSTRYLSEAAQSEAVESDPTAAYQVIFGRVGSHVSEGNPETALGEIDAFEHRLDTARAAPLLRSRLAALRASALLAAGQWDEVIKTLPLAEGVDQPAFARVLVARAYAAMLDHRAARRTLAPLLDGTAMPVRVELDVLLTEAAAAAALGQSADASVALVSALNRAAPERFVRAFLDAGPALGPCSRRLGRCRRRTAR